MARVKEFVHQAETRLLTPRSTNGIRVLEDTLHLMTHDLPLDSYLNPRPIIREAAARMADH
jgi:hypothetical protein